MKWKLLLVFTLVLAISGGSIAMAHGGMQHTHTNGSEKSGNSMAGMDMSGKDKNMDMSGSGNNMEGMDMGHDPVIDTPPNVKVLGTYGAVNLFFILIGIWNKWFRRKGDTHGYAD